LLPDLSTIVRELRERRLVCPRLPPAMHRLLGLASAPSTPSTPSGASSNRGSGAKNVYAAPIPRLQIGLGRNLGSCICTAAAAGDPLPLTNDGRRNFCLAYHYVGRCNLNCGGKATHRPLSGGGGATPTRLEGQRGGPTRRTNACSCLTTSSIGPAAFTVSSARPGSPGSRKSPIHTRPRTLRVPCLGAPA
jgi:hypothetical protein